ncbi:MAG: Hsp20/alpha crystallin family protein [Salinibacter sp.]
MNTLTRRPTRSLRGLHNEVNRMFETLFPSWDADSEEARPSMWTPRMDVTETDNAYHLHVDLPGLTKDNVTISVEDNRLTIRGERHNQTETESENMVRMERTFGSFYRSVRLPKMVQENEIKATFANGVLTIDAPKAEVSKPKHIAIS